MAVDFQVLAIALAIIVLIVLLLTAFLYLGGRERSFEEAYGQDRIGLLLHDDEKKRKEGGQKQKKDKHHHKPHKKLQAQKSGGNSEDTADDVVPPAAVAVVEPPPRPIVADEAVAPVSVTEEPVDTKKKHKKGKRATEHREDLDATPVVTEPVVEMAAPLVVKKSEELSKPKPQQQASTGAKGPKVTVRQVDEPTEVGVEAVEQRRVVEQLQQTHTAEQAPPTQTEPSAEEQTDKTDGTAAGKKKKKKKGAASADVQEELIVATTVATTTASTKKHSPLTTATEPDVELVIEKLKNNEKLSDAYLSTAIECLLMRQEYANQGDRHQEELAKLRQKLEDRERILAQERHASIQEKQRMSDFKQQFENERTKCVALEKTYRDQLAQKQNDVLRLTQQMEQTKQEAARFQESVRKTVENANPAASEKLRQENVKLQEQLRAIESDRQARQADQAKLHSEIRNRDQQLRLSEQKRAEADQRSREFELASNQLQAKEAELQKVRGEIELVKKDFADLEISVNRVTEKTVIMNGAAPISNGEMNGADALKENLKMAESMKRLEEQLAAEERRRTGAEQQITVLQQQITTANTDLQAQANSQLTLQRTIDGLQREKQQLTDNEGKAGELRSKELESALNAKNALEGQLQEMRVQLEEAKAKTAELDAQLKQQENKESDLVAATKSALESEVSQLKTHKDEADTRCKELEGCAKKLEKSLAEEKQVKEQLFKEVEHLKTDIDKLRQKSKDKEVVAELEHAKKDLESAKQQIKELNDTIFDHKQTVEAKEKQVSSLTEGLKNKEQLETNLLEEVETLKRTTLGHETATPSGGDIAKQQQEISALKAELEQQKAKNNELREKNYKTVDALVETEKNSKKLVAQIETKYKAQLEDQQKETEETLRKMLLLGDGPSYREWLHEIETIVRTRTVAVPGSATAATSVPAAKTHAHTQHDFTQQGTNLVEENEKLSNQVEKYRGIVEQVESDLENFEKLATSEEQKWKAIVDALEQALAKAKRENNEKDKRLRTPEEHALIQGELEKVREQLLVVETKLRTEQTERDTLRSQLIVLQQDLESERSTGRDLSSQAVKLRGMLKTGQDALSQEQSLVAQLKDQLKHFQSDSGSSGILHELEQLKVRLDDREKQLERETAVNEQLSSKLTALGVQPPSH